MIDLHAYLAAHKRTIDDYLQDRVRLLADTEHGRLWEAIDYALLSGGKRVRPILALAAAEAVGGDQGSVLPFACAIEMIHCYSLIHDDLPCMDDDDLRRGRPTLHKAFGEATALLAGDALLTMAFELLSDVSVWQDIYHHEGLEVVHEIALAAGPAGMAGGQALDLDATNREVGEEVLHRIHGEKTGALISVSVYAGARLSGATQDEMDALDEYAEKVGLAFQIRDDLLNATGDAEAMGKPVGSDREAGKSTFATVLGVERSAELLEQLAAQAVEALAGFSRSADPLRAIAQYIAEREK